MLYNDEETRKQEEAFQKNLDLVRSITPEKMEKLKQEIETLDELLAPYIGRTDLSKEETDMLDKAYAHLKTMVERINDMQLVLGESIMRQSDHIYFGIKKRAEEGDEEAIKAYEKLKPAYEAALRENMSDN